MSQMDATSSRFMSELNSYLMAKLMPRNASPRKEEKNSIATEFVKELGLDAFNSIKREEKEEVDYSAGSSFWKSAIEKSQSEERVNSKPKLSPAKAYVAPEGLPKSKSSTSVATLLKQLKNDTTSCETIEVTESCKEMVVPDEAHQRILEQLRARIGKLGTIVDKEIKEMESIVGRSDVVDQDHERVVQAFDHFKQHIQLQLENVAEKNAKLAKEYQNFQQQVLEKQATTEHTLKQWMQSIQKETEKSTPKETPMQNSPQSLDIRTLMDELKAMNHGQVLDRPTKNLIIGVNDKLIQLSKLQEHSFDSINMRLSQLEKRQSPQDNEVKNLLLGIEKRLDRIEKRARDNDLDLQRILDNLGKRHSDTDSDDELSDRNVKSLKDDIKSIKSFIEAENQLAQERMSQFLNMFTLLQDAILSDQQKSEVNALRRSLDEQTQKTMKMERILVSLVNENDRLLTLATNVNAMLTKYLPLNLESKLYKIEHLLVERAQ
jgi:hypothetical protein